MLVACQIMRPVGAAPTSTHKAFERQVPIIDATLALPADSIDKHHSRLLPTWPRRLTSGTLSETAEAQQARPESAV